MDIASEIIAAKDFLSGSKMLTKKTRYYVIADNGVWDGPFPSIPDIENATITEGRIVSVAVTLERHGIHKPGSLEV